MNGVEIVFLVFGVVGLIICVGVKNWKNENKGKK